MNARTNRNVRGFTLLELLVVVTIIALLLITGGVLVVKSLLSAGEEDGAIGAIKAAVATIRSYSGVNPPFPYGEYQGGALIVTPARELRITLHFHDPEDNSVKLIDEVRARAGYKDTGDPQTVWPEGVGIVGLTREGVGPPKLIATPFAIAFDRWGRMTVDNNLHKLSAVPEKAYNKVVYNGHATTSGMSATEYDNLERPNDYDPGPYDPESPSWDSSNHSTTYGYVTGPFDECEKVIAVVSYSKAELADAGLDLKANGANGGINDAARDWLLANGRTIFFNRHTGDVIKIPQSQ